MISVPLDLDRPNYSHANFLPSDYPAVVKLGQSTADDAIRCSCERGKEIDGGMRAVVAAAAVVVAFLATVAAAGNENHVFTPCADSKIQRRDGFTFGLALDNRESFYSNGAQLSPCDSRLSLSSGNAQIAVFRPKVDEISILTINTSNSPSIIPTSFKVVFIFHQMETPLVANGGFMVAFAGRKYAARSIPIFIGNSTYAVTSFTLVLEFKKGRLQNLYWKRDGCNSCSNAKSAFVCLNNQVCAIKTSSCKPQGAVDCSIGIQLAFSGTDKHQAVLNSWYEVSNLKQYSLFGLYSNLRDSLTSQYNKFF
ncbi:hypothetical protein ZIOFF_008531 [Zingiber officinale]|uniref:Expp1 protein n=1 Tax=Zingiber officinale TaxID=94328 RepID=A0A8J5M6S5_ZINOF|nr:hypothetical protein ZIOFF_008531 [Zingiber officinale]